VAPSLDALREGTDQVAPEPTVSVVMPARDAAATIGEQLDALAAQSFDGGWEVIVVDDGSNDDTAQIAREFEDRLPFLTVLSSAKSLGVSPARNKGTRAARGGMIAYCDADDVVSSRWLAGLVSALGDNALATGPVDNSRLNPPRVHCWRPPQQRVWGPWNGYLPPVIGANMAVRRDMFDLIGGFDETLAICEDMDFTFRVQLAGGTIGFGPDAVVHRRLRRGWAYFRRQYEYGFGQVELYCRFRHKGMRRGARSGAGRLARAFLGAPLAVVPKYRYEWATLAGQELGRVKGSLVARTLFL
jgi:glycosyltransferase involved in cell wall biosynthesis